MTLVIGYGNPLRGDDGAGWAVLDRLRSGPGVEIVRTQMLVPELVDQVAAASSVIFVDARVGTDAGAVQCHPVAGHAGTHALGHVAGPEGLLDLTEALTGRRPDAWLVSVTGVDFGVGGPLSAAVLRAVPEAARVIAALIRQ